MPQPPVPPANLQYRLSQGDQRLYDPNRDCAHNLRFVAQVVAGRLEDGAWPYLDALVAQKGVGMDQLGWACKAFILFVQTATDDPGESMQSCMERSGWFEVPEMARVAYLALLGTAVQGIYFHGARVATLAGQGPAQEAKSMPGLLAAADEAIACLRRPPWRRALYRLGRRLKGAWLALRRQGG